MNRREALRILGLGEDATDADIKTAYRETAQILHPDRFAGNKKLEERATEQFKNLQDAYEFLTSGGGSRARSNSGRAAGQAPPRRRARSSAADAEARLAGIAAARVQLVAQRDLALDERRNGIVMAAVGAIVALVCWRRPFGLFGVIAAIGTTAAVWGLVQIASAQRTIATLDEHLDELAAEKRRLLELLDDD